MLETICVNCNTLLLANRDRKAIVCFLHMLPGRRGNRKYKKDELTENTRRMRLMLCLAKYVFIDLKVRRSRFEVGSFKNFSLTQIERERETSFCPRGDTRDVISVFCFSFIFPINRKYCYSYITRKGKRLEYSINKLYVDRIDVIKY